MENQTFDYKAWEPVIATEIGEKSLCDRCGKVVDSAKIGEHLYCPSCQKYVWRKRDDKK